MNYRGSYRRLLGNAKAAIIGAVEIYNKPAFEYRDECFVILLLNAWELALKAVMSKKGKSIFYPKKRGEPYRTLSLKDALGRAAGLLPKALPCVSKKRLGARFKQFSDIIPHILAGAHHGVQTTGPRDISDESTTGYAAVMNNQFPPPRR